MVSFKDFTTSPDPGYVSVCERDGQLCSLPVAEVNQSQYGSVLSSYPDININRDALHLHPGIYVNYGRNENRQILVRPANESMFKRLTRTFFEDGFLQALNEAHTASEANPILHTIAGYVKHMFDATAQLNTFFCPYFRERNVANISKLFETRDWKNSHVRCMRWHPNCFKLAIATMDDTVRIYSDELGSVPMLKNGSQKCITSLAWRPLSAGELAVGCQYGVVLWILDPKSHVIRPLSQVVFFKSGNHFPITSVEWNPKGTLLATASSNDTDILMWDVDSNRNTPLKRIGFPCTHLRWSPNGERLCSATVGNVFRVWETNKWTPERWIVPTGSIQSVAWSPCSTYLLFVTTEASTLFSLCFVEDHLTGTDAMPKQALPIADLSRNTVDGNEIGGLPQSICWSPNGKYVAVMFKDTTSIAIFNTSINRHSLNISPLFIINHLTDDEHPSYICFQAKYANKHETVLSIAWSTGRIQYFPFI